MTTTLKRNRVIAAAVLVAAFATAGAGERVRAIEVTPRDVNLFKGWSQQLLVSGRGRQGRDFDLTTQGQYTSSNPKVF